MVVFGGGALGHRQPSLGPPCDNSQGVVLLWRVSVAAPAELGSK